MTAKELKQKQTEMPNDVLIVKVEHQITTLAGTGGRSHQMCVPPEITDTDMLLSELVRRFKEQEQQITELSNKLEWCKTDSATLIKKYNSRGEQIKELEELNQKLVDDALNNFPSNEPSLSEFEIIENERIRVYNEDNKP